MAWSLETRVPFLDTVVDELRLLPARTAQGAGGSTKKRLLRKAVEPLLPDEVVHGRKRGFSIPAAAWLRGRARAVRARDARSGDAAPPGLPPSRGRDAVLDDHVSGREDLSRQLWGLLAFTLWHERHVEG